VCCEVADTVYVLVVRELKDYYCGFVAGQESIDLDRHQGFLQYHCKMAATEIHCVPEAVVAVSRNVE
ncbi:hypothetical protein TcasGA2_TC016144, partial [Tribolium castaneum]